jgi:nucleotidyltransferase/DNA polymerase involved in DNA repair
MLADKPVGFIFGVGKVATQERLSQRGFRTIADLQRADETELMKQFRRRGPQAVAAGARHRRASSKLAAICSRARSTGRRTG